MGKKSNSVQLNSISYYIDKNNQTIVCVLSGCKHIAVQRLNKYCRHFVADDKYVISDIFVGKAKCSPDDEWNEDYGKKIALNRARHKRNLAINKKIREALLTSIEELTELVDHGMHFMRGGRI